MELFDALALIAGAPGDCDGGGVHRPLEHLPEVCAAQSA